MKFKNFIKSYYSSIVLIIINAISASIEKMSHTFTKFAAGIIEILYETNLKLILYKHQIKYGRRWIFTPDKYEFTMGEIIMTHGKNIRKGKLGKVIDKWGDDYYKIEWNSDERDIGCAYTEDLFVNEEFVKLKQDCRDYHIKNDDDPYGEEIWVF